MRVLVTGGTGFIGSYLVAALRKRGDDVICLVRQKIRCPDPGVKCYQADLSEERALQKNLGDIGPCQAIFHFGAMLPSRSQSGNSERLYKYLPVNVNATALLLEAGAQWKSSSFVYASGLPVIGKPGELPVDEDHPAKPEHPYLLSKYLGELTCEFFRRMQLVPVTSLRISSPYGPGMSQDTVLAKFVQRARCSRDIQLFGNGSRRQNFIHVTDVIKAALLASEGEKPDVYNVAGAEDTSMSELAQLIVKTVPGCTSKVVFSGGPDPQEDYRWVVNGSRAEIHLGFRPEICLEDGVRDYVSSLNEADSGLVWRNPCG